MTNLILLLLVINFVSDQLFQSRKVLAGKDESTMLMCIHVLCWALPMAIFAWIIVHQTKDLWALKWLAAIIPIHFLIEWSFSRAVTEYMRKKEYATAITIIHMEKLLLNLGIISTFLLFSQ